MPSYAITGAARGLGYEFVNQLSVDTNNTVFALVRRKATSQKLEALGRSNVHIIEADISDYDALKAAAAEVSRVTGGTLDVLVNNAAFVDLDVSAFRISDFTTEAKIGSFTESFNINVVGTIKATNSFLPLLEAGTLKKVILISTGLASESFNVITENPVHVPYIISKVAANAIWWKYAIQYKDQGFTFLAMSPGYVDTSTSPPTEEDKLGLAALEQSFRKFKPDFTGHITPEESVKFQLETISKAGPKDSGSFVSHFGNQEWL